MSEPFFRSDACQRKLIRNRYAFGLQIADARTFSIDLPPSGAGIFVDSALFFLYIVATRSGGI